MTAPGHTNVAGGLDQTYDAHFYEDLASEVRGSAEVIVPIVVDLLRPQSVLDIGCGRGTWLDVFRRHGVTDVVGVDGAHVARDDLEIPPDAFIAHDLREPVALDRRFDLAVSLEVAEHLAPVAAAGFVASLVAHAPAVLFSAAIPFQGGAGHVHERWPSYWADVFQSHGYVALDIVRPAVWHDERVAFWYAQNTLLYVRDVPPGVTPAAIGAVRDLVHPALHIRERTAAKRPPAPPSLRRALRDARAAAARALRRRTSTTRTTTR
jgi:SAM-dependent methyltransferase